MHKNSQQLHQKKTKPPQIMQAIAITGVAFAFTFAALAYPTHQTKAQEQSTTTTTSTQTAVSTQSSTKTERERLEDKLAELEEKIEEQQQTVLKYKNRGKTLQSEINRLDAEIRSTELQIQAAEVSLQKINQDIYETQRNINRTQNKIEEHKEALGESLQKVYETDKQSLIAILLKNDQVSDFFNSVNNILLVQNNIRTSLDEVVNLRQDLIQEKQELGQEKQEAENLKQIRESQKYQIQVAQNQKEQVLTATEQKEARYQQILEETKKTAAEIRNQIFKLIGGSELSFESAYDLAKLAESGTGIRAALTMAILDRESGLGSNVGSCQYDKVLPETGETVMHPERDIPVFEAMLTRLKKADIAPLEPTVSCPILSHGNHGGAMGPAQFIPSTWAIYGGYEKVNGEWEYDASEDRIRQATGDTKPSSPWNNADAFTATALYIKDLINSSGCQNYGEEYKHVLPKQTLVERCAAAKYYSGSRWWTYRFWYGDAVLERAEEIQQDIDVISS